MPVSNRNRLAIVCLWLIGVILPVAGLPTVGQERTKREREDSEETKRQLFRPFAVPDNRTAFDSYDEALRALAGGRFATALPRLQKLLDQYANKVVSVPVDDGQESLYHGYSREVDGLLGGLPPDGLKVYREIYDGHAQRLLDRAIEARALGDLLEVVRRYRHTSAGPGAMATIADVYLERGEPAAAAHFYLSLADRLMKDEAATEHRGNALSRAVYALARAGHEDDARTVGVRLSELTGRNTITAAGHAIPIADAIARWRPVRTRDDGPGAFGTFEDRPRLAWSRLIPMSFDLDPAHQYVQAASQVVPTSNGDALFAQNGLGVWAFDLSDGTERWHFPGPKTKSVDRPNSRVIYTGAVHEDLYVCNLEVGQANEEHYYQAIPIQKPLPIRRLFAFDGKSGGLRWSHAPRSIPAEMPLSDRKFLARTSVSSTPIIWEGAVLSAMSYFEGKVYAYLTAVDAETGALRWRTLICTGQKVLNMFGRPIQEPVLGVPLVRDGIVYFTSNLGVVAAVDARFGRILWLGTYPLANRPAQTFMMDVPETPGWKLCEPALASGVFVTVPIDSEYALGFDARTGRLLWKSDREPGNTQLEYLIGVRDNTVLLNGNCLVGLDVRTGAAKWPTVTFSREEQTGWRGWLTGDSALVSTERALHAIDPVRGVHRAGSPTLWSTTDSGGNVSMAGRDTLVTAGSVRSEKRVSISVFYDSRARIERLEALLAKHEDPATRIALARTLVQVGRVDEGQRQFETVSRSLPVAHDPRTQSLRLEADRGRYDALRRRSELAAAAKQPESARAFLDAAIDVARPYPFHLDALLAKRDLLSANDDRDGLVALYRALATTFPDRRHDFVDWGEIPVGLWAHLESAALHEAASRPADAVASLQAVLRRYAGERIGGPRPVDARGFAVARITTLIKRHGRETYAAFDRRADELIARGDPDSLREVLVGLPNAIRYTEGCLALGRHALTKGRPTDAIHVIRRLFANHGPIEAPMFAQATADLTAAYATLRFDDPAADLLDRLEALPDTEIVVRGGRTSSRAWAQTQRAALAARTPRLPIPSGRVPQDVIWNATFPNRSELAEIPTDRVDPTLLFVAETSRDTGALRVLAFSANGSDPAWTIKLPAGARRTTSLVAFRMDDVVVLPLDQHLLAVDRATGRLRWKRAWKDRTIAGITRGAGTVITVTNPTRLEPTHEATVEAIEIASGTTAWTHQLDGAFPLPPSRRGGHVVITTRQRPATVHAIDVLTGRVDTRKRLDRVEQFLGVSPADVRDVGLLVCTDGKRELELLVAGAPDSTWRTRLADALIEDLTPGGPGALVIAAVDPPEGRPRRAHQRATCFDASAQKLAWSRDFPVDTVVEAEDILGADDYWVLPTRDDEGSVSLLTIDAGGRTRWQADNTFQSGTFRTQLRLTRFGVLAIGFDPTVRDEPEIATTHIVLLDAADGSERARWEVDEPRPPSGIRPAANGFFVVWPQRIDFYGSATR